MNSNDISARLWLAAKPALLTAAIFAAMLSVPAQNLVTEAEEQYLPDAAASRVVSVSRDGSARSSIVILTTVTPGNESDPREMKVFGLLYSFFPRTIFVYRDQPTSLSFWNLQSDERHDFMLTDPLGKVLMKLMLPELKKTAVTLSFHQEGLFNFYCTMHQPEMSGQIMVLPPRPDAR